jgi:hypothetical protein
MPGREVELRCPRLLADASLAAAAIAELGVLAGGRRRSELDQEHAGEVAARRWGRERPGTPNVQTSGRRNVRGRGSALACWRTLARLGGARWLTAASSAAAAIAELEVLAGGC